MTHKNFVAAAAAVFGLGIVALTGCGGNSGGGGGGPLQPSISSFSSSPAIVTDGANSNLTGVFSNGTGMITPGSTSATSGTAASVTPPNDATTTYTLTVTGASGTTPATATTTIQAVAAPSITSFTAGASTIGAGNNTTLTAVFSNGTGVVTPGNVSVTSGTAITVSPATTTTYTLTVTNAAGMAVTLTAPITVNPQPAITSFITSAADVTDGGQVTLTAVYTNGTGVITPGNVTVASGTGVKVTPPVDTKTIYTLTVTGAAGTTPVTLTTSVTAVAAPAITSFAASPTSIASGSSAQLTAVFTGGTGVVTPGNLPITSATPLSVSPTSTTTYTLTVTNLASTAITQTAMVTVVPQPAITSFTASPTIVTNGSTSSLTAVFTGGTGVVTPGNISVTSGTAVSVTPPSGATTTYTLTVTGGSGTTPATKTTTVQAVAAPAITSFTASPTSISSGSSSNLTGVFTGGTGVVTPGSLSITSGTALSVSPAATTTYTLTVTNAASTAVTQTAVVTVAAAPNATVTVDPSNPGIAVTNQLLGMNLAAWYVSPSNASSINTAFNQAGIKAIRWPGGSWSDGYHWGYQTGSSTLVAPYNCACSSPTSCTANSTNWAGNQTFAQFASLIPEAGPFDLALTANYGTNESCNGGGDPKEAAAWAAAAVTDGITVSHMTVGNEEYGSWETDLHSTPNDPTIYAAAVVGSSGYYSLIKTASPSTLVGVVVDANANNGCCTKGWDTTVLGNAKGSYDFVEFHYYPQNPGGEHDTYLVSQAAQDFTTNINTVKSELTTAGAATTPIYVGEMGSVSSNPGKQSLSITQGLYAGQMLGEMMNDGIVRGTWWIGFGNCNGSAGNDGTSLYGWQDYGAYNVFSDGPTVDPTCPDSGPDGTMNPTAQAYNLFQNVAVNGEHVLTPAISGDAGAGKDVRAYAVTHAGGTALVLFNVNETTSKTVQLTVTGESSSPGVTVMTYDKEMYDYTDTTCQTDPTCTYDSTHNYSTVEWVSPSTTDMGTQSLPLTLTLTPWSMNVVLIK